VSGKVRRVVYEAALRSGWDTYGGAIEAAHAGEATRLVDCLRGRKPLAADDRDRLTDFVSKKLRRRLWPDLLANLLGRPPVGLDYDHLADLVEQLGRGRGRVHDDLVHQTARLVDVILSGRSVPKGWRRSIFIAQALVATINDETGYTFPHDAPLRLVRRDDSDEKKKPWPSVMRMASDKVDKVLRLDLDGGYAIVGKKPSMADADRVSDLFEQVSNLFNRPKKRRQNTR
jgi:hypothetical protein